MRALTTAFNRLPKPVRVVIALLLFLTLALTAGCGAQPAATAPAGSAAEEVAPAAAPADAPAIVGATPEEAHAQWLAGMEQQDRQALMPLMAADMPPTRLDAAMSQMWGQISGEGRMGAFTGVEDKGIAEEGERRVGYSLWQFAGGSRCYRLSLAAEGAGWRAVGWGEAKEGCE